MKNTLRRLLAALPLLALSAVPACSSDDPSNATTGDENEVVDVPNTGVKDQSIGNCWIYATAAWAESLRLRYSGESMNISESYLSYIDWFHGIQAGDFSEKDGIQTGGWFGEAAEYMRRYGVMDEGTFIPEEANAEESLRQKQALNAINASLKTGVLSNPQNRKNATLVREELDKAFNLNASVIQLLDASFGRDLARHLKKGATIPAGQGLRAPSDIEVGFYKPKTGQPRTVSLSEALGEPSFDSSFGWRNRTGTFAWSETSYPSSPTAQRTFQIRVQQAMHARYAAIFVWFVDFNAMNKSTGAFNAVPASPGRQGGHMVVAEDYQINNVPGFGTLAAGTVVSDLNALTAALDPSASIEFFRVKNSWGSGFQPPEGTDLKGYHDLYMPYLNGQIPVCDQKDAQGKCINPRSQRGLTAVVLPSSAWNDVSIAPESTPDPEPTNTCAHGLCSTGAALVKDCDPCVAKICEQDPFCCGNSWDGVCIKEVTSICEQSCQPLGGRGAGGPGGVGGRTPEVPWGWVGIFSTRGRDQGLRAPRRSGGKGGQGI